MPNAPRPNAAGVAGEQTTTLRRALDVCRNSFVSAGAFSLFINLLMLMPALYMLQVYDRVLASSSESTLLLLTLLAVFLFAVMGGLEWVRGQIMIATSLRLDALLGGRLFNALFARTLASGGRVSNVQPLSDLLNLRQFLTGPGLLAFFDAPWFPVYVAVLFAFHWMLGLTALFSAVVLLALAIWNESVTQPDLDEANKHAQEAANQTQRNLRNAEAIAAMGMLPRLRDRWLARQSKQLELQARASARGGVITASSKTFRMAMQSLVLGLGAYLAIRGEVTPGVIIAASILMGRALAPLDQLINSWRGFRSAREAYDRVEELLEVLPPDEKPMPLPAPKGALSVERVTVVPPGGTVPILKNISMPVTPGSTVAIIGPSGAGKSTLARAILGIMPASQGAVRLDGAELGQWDRDVLGQYVGYLPQDVELLDGTVGENIARFGEVDAEQVVKAAKAAGVHEMILRLSDGYDTVVTGQVLSAGQRQRVGLARALYGNPSLLLLDEPNSNLDQDGDLALARALQALKQAKRTVVLITHRNNLLSIADRILLIVEGEVAMFDERDKVLASLQQASAARAGNPQSTQTVIVAPGTTSAPTAPASGPAPVAALMKSAAGGTTSPRRGPTGSDAP